MGFSPKENIALKTISYLKVCAQEIEMKFLEY
jgi:hypothetical protein